MGPLSVIPPVLDAFILDPLLSDPHVCEPLCLSVLLRHGHMMLLQIGIYENKTVIKLQAANGVL